MTAAGRTEALLAGAAEAAAWPATPDLRGPVLARIEASGDLRGPGQQGFGATGRGHETDSAASGSSRSRRRRRPLWSRDFTVPAGIPRAAAVSDSDRPSR